MMQAKQPSPALMARISRRTALVAGFALVVGASWWRLPTPKNGSARRLRAFAERMVRVLGLHEAPVHQAQSDNLMIFSEAELTRTINSLMQVDVTDHPEVLALSDQSLRSHLRTMITNDYRAGTIVQLHGWWLSKTESLCLELLRMR